MNLQIRPAIESDVATILRFIRELAAFEREPDAVIATGPAFPGRSRPLCAYPQHATYKGQGNPEDAASFECRD